MIDDLTETLFDTVLDADVGLGRAATYTSPAGAETVFEGDFGEAGETLELAGTDSQVSTTQPTCGVRASAFAAGHPQQDGLIIFDAWPERLFRIDDVQPAEVGWLNLYLVEVS